MATADFLRQWQEDPKELSKDVIVVDEGDQLLLREVAHKQTSAWPKSWVLLSALPRESWSPAQQLSFHGAKGRSGFYIDTTCVVPQDRRLTELLVQLAVARSQECPVLFWGKSSVYAGF